MTAIRLSKELRQSIADKAVDAVYPEISLADREERHEAFIMKYSLALYELLYSEEERKLLQAAPEGMVPERNYLRFRAVDTKQRLDRTMHIELLEKMPMFFLRTEYGYPLLDLTDSPIDLKQMLEEERATSTYELNTMRRKYVVPVLEFLNQFKTTKQVYAAWPEGRIFLPSTEKTAKKSTALMIRPDAINKLLNLSA